MHFDAHADTGDIEFGSLYGHGQPMRRLIESGAARGDRFLQIGLRGYWPGPETLDWMAEQGMRSFEMTEIVARGLDTCLDEAFGIAVDDCDGVFLSVDIDVADPAHAPGTGTPEPGGLSARRAARRGPPGLPRAAGGGDRRRRGLAAVRPRGHHRGAGQPGRPGGAVRHRRPAAGHRLRPAATAAGRPRSRERTERMRILLVGAGGVGSAAVGIAARRDFFEAMVVADYDVRRAERARRAPCRRRPVRRRAGRRVLGRRGRGACARAPHHPRPSTRSTRGS